jgi:hypothetical protein
MGETAEGNRQEVSDWFRQDFSRKGARTPRKENKIRKHEIRNKVGQTKSKCGQISNAESASERFGNILFLFGSFELVSKFGFRASDRIIIVSDGSSTLCLNGRVGSS